MGPHVQILAIGDRSTPGSLCRERRPRRSRALVGSTAAAAVLVGSLVFAQSDAAAALTGSTGTASPAGSVLAGTTGGAASSAGASATSSAGASAASGTTAGTVVNDAIVADWGGPTTHLRWDGSGYSTAAATFVGDRVFSPGDRVSRTLEVGNAGPSAGVLSVSIRVGQDVPDESRNRDLAQDVTLFWDVGGIQGSQAFAAVLDSTGATDAVAQVAVPQGADVPVTVGVAMARDVTGDRNAAQASTLLAFDVVVHLEGETPAAGGLAMTGASLAGWAGLALALIGTGLLFVLARRRRCASCDRVIGHAERWFEWRRLDGSRQAQCVDCHVHGDAHATGCCV